MDGMPTDDAPAAGEGVAQDGGDGALKGEGLFLWVDGFGGEADDEGVLAEGETLGEFDEEFLFLVVAEGAGPVAAKLGVGDRGGYVSVLACGTEGVAEVAEADATGEEMALGGEEGVLEPVDTGIAEVPGFLKAVVELQVGGEGADGGGMGGGGVDEAADGSVGLADGEEFVDRASEEGVVLDVAQGAGVGKGDGLPEVGYERGVTAEAGYFR